MMGYDYRRGFMLSLVALMMFATKDVYANTWSQDQNGGYYISENGTPKIGWVSDNGQWYYSFSDGKIIQDQMRMIDGNRYYFGSTGAMLKNSWYQNQDGAWYFFNEHGAGVNGWLHMGGTVWYCFRADGKMIFDNSTTIEGEKYYFNEDGTLKVNSYQGAKYLGDSGKRDSRYDIKVRGKVDAEVLDEAGNATNHIPGWLLKHIVSSGWKIALNTERENYGTVSHDDYVDSYAAYYGLEKDRKLIFFTQSDYILQGIGEFVANDYAEIAKSEDFQGAYSTDWDGLSGILNTYPIIEHNKQQAFAEVFALYYSSDLSTQQEFQENCPSLYDYLNWSMSHYYQIVQQKTYG